VELHPFPNAERLHISEKTGGGSAEARTTRLVSWIAPSAESYGTPWAGQGHQTESHDGIRLSKTGLLIVDNPALLFQLCLETNSRDTFGIWNGSGQAVRGFVDGLASVR
jgi:hypothetical protein